MTEGDEPKKSTPSIPPDRAATLARKLSGGRAPALGRQPTAPPSSNPEPPVVSKREAVLSARRASATPLGNQVARPGDDGPSSKAPTKPARTRKGFLVLGAILLLGLLVAVGLYAKQEISERSPEGRVLTQMLMWEFAPSSDNAAREAAFAGIDGMGPAAVGVVIEKLTDASLPSRGSSHSSRSVQMIAHHYLMRFATNLKTPPPPVANDIAKVVLEGATVPAAKWLAARDAWREWLAAQQAKGTVPK